jgi:hypothetical protein
VWLLGGQRPHTNGERDAKSVKSNGSVLREAPPLAGLCAQARGGVCNEKRCLHLVPVLTTRSAHFARPCLAKREQLLDRQARGMVDTAEGLDHASLHASALAAATPCE